MNPSSINNWVKDGRLTAFRTPGGHRRIRAGDLVSFLTTHSMPVPDGLVGATRRRLLWVQSDPTALKDAARQFSKHEAFVEGVFVDNAVHALVQFGLTRPNILVFDLAVSGLDAHEAVKHLRSLPDVEQHQTFFICDHVDDITRKAAEKVGAIAIERDNAVAVVLGALDL